MNIYNILLLLKNVSFGDFESRRSTVFMYNNSLLIIAHKHIMYVFDFPHIVSLTF